jgi:hypothetical protein
MEPPASIDGSGTVFVVVEAAATSDPKRGNEDSPTATVKATATLKIRGAR